MTQGQTAAERLVASLDTVEECERCIVAALRRAIELSAARPATSFAETQIDTDTKTETQLVEAELYEALEIKETTRRHRATRFRPTIAKYGGIIPAADRTVSKPRPGAVGIFQKLAEMGLLAKTFEATIMRHPHLFSRQAIAKAKRNLDLASEPKTSFD